MSRTDNDVRVISASPDREITLGRGWASVQQARRLARGLRRGLPQAILILASDRASCLNGAVIPVDGGRVTV